MNRLAFIAIAAAALSLFAGWARANVLGGADVHPMMWGGWGWWGMIVGPVMMIAVIAAIIVVAVLILRWLGGPALERSPPASSGAQRTPLDLLKERLARGEIDSQEFEEKRRLLSD